MPLLTKARLAGKRVVVPYCVGEELGLFHLLDDDELAQGTMKIPEPRQELRGLPERRIDPRALDLIVVPGLAFDRHGGRVGYGGGFYDRLLRSTSGATSVVALAFECQIFDTVPMQPHDVYVPKIITESSIYVQSEG